MNNTVTSRLMVGIDIGKRFHQATVIDDSGRIIGGSVRFANNTPGGEMLLSRVDSVNPSRLPVFFCLEATGHYWLPLYSFLTSRGYPVAVINPYQSDAWRKVHLSSTKTDKEDSYLIADLFRFGAVSSTVLPSEELVSLRNLTRFRMALSQQITDTKRRIVTILDQIFPEFETFFSAIFGKTAKAILEEYPTPDSLEKVSLRKLANLVSRLSQGRFKTEKAREIKDAAASSFGVTFAMDSFTLELRLLLGQLEFLAGQIQTVEKEIATVMAKTPTTLTTIPGVSLLLAATIIAEIGDIKRFKTSSQLVAYAGINPTVRQSGQFSSNQNRMAKKGSPYLRLALWQAAVVAIRFNPVLKDYYQKRLAEGKNQMVVIGAVARKLTGIIFALLRDNKDFVVLK
jgi:transposase